MVKPAHLPPKLGRVGVGGALGSVYEGRACLIFCFWTVCTIHDRYRSYNPLASQLNTLDTGPELLSAETKAHLLILDDRRDRSIQPWAKHHQPEQEDEDVQQGLRNHQRR